MRRSMSLTAPVVAVALLISTFAPAAFAQQVSGDWTSVQSVGINENLAIKLKDGKKVSGKFSSANESELTIIRKGRQQVIAKDTIAQVHHVQRKSEKGKYAAIGTGIGAGVGGGLGAIKASSGRDDYEIYYVMGAVLGAGFGALGGLLFGAAKRQHMLIYEAP